MRFPWNRNETELEREVAHHLQQLTAEFERRGYSYPDAFLLARREFGGTEQVKERCRDERRWVWLSGLWKDFAFALRHLRRSPGFAVTAVLILSLGIAANLIVFNVLEALILRPLDVPHPDRVMTLAHTDQPDPSFSYPQIRDLRANSTLLSAVAAWSVWTYGMEANGVTRPVWGFFVDGQYFQAVGVKPLLGRLLTPADDDHPNASATLVLSWQTWQTDFGADPKIVGKVVRINKNPYTVVGVTPQGFYGTEKFFQPAFFIPLSSVKTVQEMETRRDNKFWAVVRVKDGVSAAQVQAELNTIVATIRRQHPKEEEKLNMKVVPAGLMGDWFSVPGRAFLGGVMALAGIVLLAACANLSGLFAARTADRAREMAIRLAIGSSRWRIIRQVLVEASLISLLAGTCAFGVAWFALNNFAAWRPPTEFPLQFLVAAQPSLILVSLLVSLFAAVVLGLIPLRQIFKTDPNDAIKSGGSQSLAGRRWAFGDLLLAAQIALCCVTVTAAFVSLRGLAQAVRMDLGFEREHAVVARFVLDQAGYSDVTGDRFQRELLEKLKRLPGVSAAGYAGTTPLTGETDSYPVFAPDVTDFSPARKAFDPFTYQISPGYFAAAGSSLLAGRDVSWNDTAKNPAVAVVNRQFALRLFHSANAVGRYFRNTSGTLIQIVGIVADGKYAALSEDPQPAAFLPISQAPSTNSAFVVRLQPDSSAAATSQMADSVRKAIRELDPTVPIRQCGPWSSQLGLIFFPIQVGAAALAAFGIFGLLLSVAGTFGLASYTVSKRLRELSIRVALGAEAKQILASSLGRILVLLSVGSAAGLLLGVAASRVLSAIVYQASANDPYVLLSVASIMSLTGVLSVAGPVRRALHVDPAALLREQ